MSWSEELADGLLAAAHAVHGRTEELREGLRAKVAQLRTQAAPPATEQDGARIDALRDELMRIDALIAEAGAEAARLSGEILAACRVLSDRLLPAARGRLVRRSRTELHDRVQQALSAFGAELTRLSARIDTTAQQEAALKTMTEFAGGRREQLREAFAAASGRAAELQAFDDRTRHIRESSAALNERERELLTKLSQHAHPDGKGSALVEGILAADERTAVSLRKHLLLPLLSDLEVERTQDFYDADPLARLEQSMRGGA